MSSTNRGVERNKDDYYYTPIQTIQDFWRKFCEVENLAYHHFNFVLDPASGGDENRPCAYPEALKIFNYNFDEKSQFVTIDIRKNSKAEYKADYLLTNENLDLLPELIITNPPFKLFEKFVEKAFKHIRTDGYIIMLLRLNATGGQARRKEFWDKYKPKAIYVHSKRPCFVKGGSDSCEYAHFVWVKRGNNNNDTWQKGAEETKFYWV